MSVRSFVEGQGFKPAVNAQAVKGRGATSNIASRFSATTAEPVVDDWSERSPQMPMLDTVLYEDKAKTIIATNSSPDVPFDRSINPYQGCEHGCIYCYARPSHAYWDASPGLDFESKIFYKSNAAALLERELSRPSYRVQPITLGANTDPYQPVEARLEITQSIIEVLARYRHPFSIITKGAGILRDLPRLESLAQQNLVTVNISVTTLDDNLKRKLEPRAAAPEARLRTVRALADAGIPTGILLAPIIPAINDAEIERILQASSDAGARSANYILLRLPLEVRPLFRQWLANHYPDKFNHVMNLIRETRGGRENSAQFKERMTGTGAYADMIKQRFLLRRNQLGLGDKLPALNTQLFIQAPQSSAQLTLF